MKLRTTLKRLLAQKDLTTSQLGRATGISSRTLQNWLSGQKPRDLTQVHRVAKYLNVSIETLCFGDYDRSNESIMKEFAKDSIYAGRYEVVLRRIKETE